MQEREFRPPIKRNLNQRTKTKYEFFKALASVADFSDS